MQIRTPKRYRGVQRRRVMTRRRLLFYLTFILLFAFGIAIYINRQTIGLVVEDAIHDLENRTAT